MKRNWKSMVFALSLGAVSLVTIPSAKADQPRDYRANARESYRQADNDRQNDNARIDARLQAIDQERAQLDAREQHLRAELQNISYNNNGYYNNGYYNNGYYGNGQVY